MSSATKAPRAPAHLSDAARRWWRKVAGDYVFKDHHLKMLTAAAESWDRCNEARELLEPDGLVIDGRYGLKAHPAVGIEKDSRTALRRAMRELDRTASRRP